VLAAQLRAHPELQAASLEESLRSVEAQCYVDPTDVSLSGKICGFRLTRIMPGTEQLPLRFKVEGKLKDGESATRDWRLGAVFQEKGMYQLPQLAEQDYVLSVDLVPVGALKAQVAREPVTGVRIPFSYLSDLQNPIVFGSDQIVSVKQGETGVVITRGADAKTKKKKRFGIF
jgi:hypothetical protein